MGISRIAYSVRYGDFTLMTVQPFTINVPQAVLDDLRDRLARTRWPDEPEGAGWAYGTNLGYMKTLVDYWLNKYDWRKHEAALNKYAHFKADVDGVNVHFIHERGKGPNPTPIILTLWMAGLVLSFSQGYSDAHRPGEVWGQG